MNAKTRHPPPTPHPHPGRRLFTAGISVTARLHPFSPLATLFVFDCRQARLAKSALSAAIKVRRAEGDLYPCFVLCFSLEGPSGEPFAPETQQRLNKPSS